VGRIWVGRNLQYPITDTLKLYNLSHFLLQYWKLSLYVMKRWNMILVTRYDVLIHIARKSYVYSQRHWASMADGLMNSSRPATFLKVTVTRFTIVHISSDNIGFSSSTQGNPWHNAFVVMSGSRRYPAHAHTLDSWLKWRPTGGVLARIPMCRKMI
jgi:hypothetical protein